MINRARTIKLMAACASLTLVAAACGSDADDAATTEAPAATEAPARLTPDGTGPDGDRPPPMPTDAAMTTGTDDGDATR